MITVTAALIEQDGKILIAQRNGEGSQPLKWEFPGGKIEEGETPEECLKRELKEELNLEVRVDKQFLTTTFDYPTWTIELLVYRAEIIGGDMQLNVHKDVRWVTPKEMGTYDFCPADVGLVKKLSCQPLVVFRRYLTVSLILSLGLLFLFSRLAGAFLTKEIDSFDLAAADFIQQNHSVAVINLMVGITTLGAPLIMILVALSVLVFLVAKKQHFWDGTMALVALSGSWIANEVLKRVFQRRRPELGLVVAVGFSFPSGHAMVSISFYGMLAYLVWINVASKRLRSFFAFCFAVLILAIGISRIYLGVHYPSDVLAGFAAGGVWLMGCILGLQSIRYYKAKA